MELEQPNAQTKTQEWTDYLYKSTAAKQGQESGNWGIMRAYGETQNDLHPLPQNSSPSQDAIPVCPADLLEAECTEETRDGFSRAPRTLMVTACAAIPWLPPGGRHRLKNDALSYNTVSDYKTPNALIYLHLQDYEKLRATPPHNRCLGSACRGTR